MKIRFIFNPRSGRNARHPGLAPHIRAFIAARGLDASLVVTTQPGHATELAREALAAGCDRIIAVGGDGTMNEIGQALLNSSAALGLVPCGSGNGLALHLGLPTDPARALDLAVAPGAPVLAIDTGTANGLPFFNAMGCGFDAEVSRRFNRLSRRGLPAYARTGLAAFVHRRTEHVVIESTGGVHHRLETLLIAVANSDQYGNRAFIAPGARVDDGLLDLVALQPVGFGSALPLIVRLFTGRLLRSPRVLHLRAARFTIRRPAAGLLHTDGETHDAAPAIEIVVRPRSLRLLLPVVPSFDRPGQAVRVAPLPATLTGSASPS